MRLFTVRIDETMLARLREVQQRDGVTAAEQVRRALRAWLANERRGPRRAPETKGGR